MLQFKPGTDVAMLNALLNVIIEEEIYDRKYVRAHTEGFENLKKHVKAFTPEHMQSICGIDAATLRTVARTYANARAAIIFWGMGISQHIHGTDNARCLIALSLITGQVGRPGTGLHPLRGQNNVQGASDAGLIPMMLPDYNMVDDTKLRARFEQAWGTELNPNRGLPWLRLCTPFTAMKFAACTSWARTRRCRIRMFNTPAKPWQNSTIWWCRIFS